MKFVNYFIKNFQFFQKIVHPQPWVLASKNLGHGTPMINTHHSRCTITQLLAHSTEAPELENVQLVVSLLCCLTAHYSSDKLRAFVRVPRFVPAVLGAVALAPDQSAVCEPCLCTLRRLLEHRLVVLRADGSHEAGGWDEDDKPNTSVVRRKSEKSCRWALVAHTSTLYVRLNLGKLLSIINDIVSGCES